MMQSCNLPPNHSDHGHSKKKQTGGSGWNRTTDPVTGYALAGRCITSLPHFQSVRRRTSRPPRPALRSRSALAPSARRSDLCGTSSPRSRSRCPNGSLGSTGWCRRDQSRSQRQARSSASAISFSIGSIILLLQAGSPPWTRTTDLSRFKVGRPDLPAKRGSKMVPRRGLEPLSFRIQSAAAGPAS
jgi:hypothetical protein